MKSLRESKANESFPRVESGAVPPSAEGWVKTDYLADGRRLPLVVRPALADLNPAAWAAASAAWVNARLLEHGAILFRGFELSSPEDFAAFARALAPQLMDYVDQHTPRTDLGGQVYTSTDYPPDQRIELHSEMSYSDSWPRKIWFFCDTPAAEGGETPLADNREVWRVLDPAVRRGFERRGVMYVRNYGGGVGLPWQRAFRTESRAGAEEQFRLGSIDFEWKTDDRLRLRYVGQAAIKHPETGEDLWFNQAHAFHPSSLKPEVRAALSDTFGEEELPNNACYGDGSPIADRELEEVRRAYARAAVSFPWQARDLLMLDNMLIAHGRAPFKGERRVLTAMAEPFRRPAGGRWR